MTFLGSWKIDDLLTFVCNTQVFATGVATDADSVPTYRVYEDETTTPILTGSMALLDSANTAGFYSEQITLSAANGFEKGKAYSIYIAATVSTIAGATHRTFQMQAEVAVASVNSGAVTTIQSGLATASALATVQADTDDIQTRIPAALTGAGNMKADALAISGDSTTADRLEAETDTWATGTLPSQSGVATGTIKLSGGVITFDTQWAGGILKVTGGTGAGYFDVIQDSVTSTNILTMGIGTALPVTLDNTSTFMIVTQPGLTADLTTNVAAAVWDMARAGHVTPGTFGEYVPANATKWQGGTIPAPAVTGVPSVDAIMLSGDAPAADNAESFFDGTGYAGTNNVIPRVTLVDAVTDVNGDIGGTVNGFTDAALQSLFNHDSGATYAGAVAGSLVKEIADNAASTLPADILDLADGIEVGMTMRQMLRGTAAKLFGKVSGGQTGTELFRAAVVDSKTRITFTDDSSGNRTAVVTDLT